MNLTHIFTSLLAALCILLPVAQIGAVQKDGRITQIIRDVKLLPGEEKPRPAAINEKVPTDTAVRTGDQSRSELTFSDLTISRLGANTIYSYNRGGRSIDLGGGSVLLCVPKDSGGGSVHSAAVTVAVTGTTLILENSRAGRNKLLVLEGKARLGLRKYPSQTRNVLAGQMLDVPAGATTLPLPVNIDLKRTMREHPLLAGWPPLPSQGLIVAAAENPSPNDPGEPVYQGQPVAGQPVGVGPIFPGIGLPGIFPGSYPGYPQGPRNPRNPGKGDTRNPPTGVKYPSRQPTPSRTIPSRGKKPSKPNEPGVR